MPRVVRPSPRHVHGPRAALTRSTSTRHVPAPGDPPRPDAPASRDRSSGVIERRVDVGSVERREREHRVPADGRLVAARGEDRGAPDARRRSHRARRPPPRVPARRRGRVATAASADTASVNVPPRGALPSSPSAHAAASTTVTSSSERRATSVAPTASRSTRSARREGRAELGDAPAHRRVGVGRGGTPGFRRPGDGAAPDERADRRAAHPGVGVGGRGGQPGQRAGGEACPQPEGRQLGRPPDRVIGHGPGCGFSPRRLLQACPDPHPSRPDLGASPPVGPLTPDYRITGCPAYSRTQCRPRDRACTRASTRAGIAAPASR